jgi:hypothetical protein
MKDTPLASPSPLLRIPNNDLSTGAYAEDERLVIVIAPRTRLPGGNPLDPELFYPPIGRCALANFIPTVSLPLLMCLPESRETGREAENGEEYTGEDVKLR